MCACRCGIRVHLREGALRYIEGNPNHPVNRGVLCAKGAAGIMKQHSPAKLKKPLKRVGERGCGDFVEIEWEEALGIATAWLGRIRETDPKKLAFFTGRDQSQALTGWWATQFGTPNYAAHGGFCSVNMAAAGLYTMGGSFWEFGEPDWDQTRYFMMFGVAEDHASNPIKIGLGKVKANGAKFVSVNPVRTGYSAIADEWVGIRPGTDGLLVFSLIRELLLADQVDFDYLARYTNAGWLV
ncbi:MAG: molybdopterin-dependent oxidoreductase, partial [Alphaproteobacteria bacterium]